MIQSQCPKCGRLVDVPSHYLGRNVKCTTCPQEFTAQPRLRPAAPSEGKLLPPVVPARSGPAMFVLVASIVLAVIAAPLSAWMLESGAKRELLQQKAAVDLQRRREEAQQAYIRGKINLAEREGLLARIRDEEEKLK